MQKGEIEHLASEIKSLLSEMETAFFEVYVEPGYYGDIGSRYDDWQLSDKDKWLYYGTRILYYRICVFLEAKGLLEFQKIFINKYQAKIESEKDVKKSESPRYEESEPSMVILDEFREFLSPFEEFDYKRDRKISHDKLKSILSNSKNVLNKLKINPKSEPVIYKNIRWFIEMVYPTTRARNKSRFIKKFSTYQPDILIPEINTSVEYKLIKRGKNIGTYLDQLKTDADSYTGDPEYKKFYAVVYFEDALADLKDDSFKVAVMEKGFPDNWEIIAI